TFGGKIPPILVQNFRKLQKISTVLFRRPLALLCSSHCHSSSFLLLTSSKTILTSGFSQIPFRSPLQMEEGSSEIVNPVFKSFNLDPEVFIDETLNMVDGMLDDAFEYYHEEASDLLETEGSERSQFLKEGIDCVRKKVQSKLDKRLGMWEKYCLHNCFVAPEGFSLPTTHESPDQSLRSEDMLSNPTLDAQLDSLRQRLSMVSKESIELNRELKDLERQSTVTDRCTQLVADVYPPHKQDSDNQLFQEMLQTAAAFRERMQNLKRRIPEEDAESHKSKKICNRTSNNERVLCNAKLEDLQEFLGELKNKFELQS
ncbi:Protein MIS12 homolog, partial [Linum grandiflorum]